MNRDDPKDRPENEANWEEAAAKVAEVEQAAGEGASHRAIAKALEELRSSTPEGDPLLQPLQWDQLLFDLWLTNSDEQRKTWGPLAPMAVFPPRVYPPPVDGFPDDALPYFRARLASSPTPASKARLADFLWLRLGGHGDARLASDAYLEAASATRDSKAGLHLHLDYLRRGIELRRELGMPPDELPALVAKECQALLDEHRDSDALYLIDFASKILAGEQAPAEGILETLRARARAAAASGGQARHEERALLGGATTLARGLRKRSEVKRLTEEAARSFEAEAAERRDEGGLIESSLLQQATERYASLGMVEDLRRAKPKLHTAGKRSLKELKSLSTEVTIKTADVIAEVERWIKAGRQVSPWHHLVLYACSPSLWPSWSEIQRRGAEYRNQFPLQYLATQVIIGPDGRQLRAPDNEEARRDWQDIHNWVRDVSLQVGFRYSQIQLFRERNAWNAELIMRALGDGAAFDDDCLAAIVPGVQALEAGRHWEALHVLTPQVERAVRRLAVLSGVEEIYRFNTRHATLRWASLDDLLDKPRVRTMLGILHPDAALQLKILLIDSRGMSLRTDVTHGIVQNRGSAGPTALLVLLILLRIASLVARPKDEMGESTRPKGRRKRKASRTERRRR